MTKYQQARTTKRGYRNIIGKMRGGKLYPVMAEAFRPSEGGILRQDFRMELDPIPGRLLTQVTGEVIVMYCPVQAADGIKDPAGVYSGLTDVIREKLLTGTPLFGLEDENEISKRLGIVPRSIGGVKKVCEVSRLAHNACVNHLRLKRYVKSVQLLATNMLVTPAILTQTILDRLNGVLDPEDRVNGVVNLTLPSMQLPVEGIGLVGSSLVRGSGLSVRGTTAAQDWTSTLVGAANPTHMILRDSATAADVGIVIKQTGANATARPNIYARLNATTAGNVSLDDFYNAQTMDRLMREMRMIIDEDPEFGEDAVLNWAYGLAIDIGSTPWVLAERRLPFMKAVIAAMDQPGVNNDIKRTDGVLEFSIETLVPKTELGGIVITFLVLRPDENLASQPHPVLSDVWGIDNFVADELKLDPVPVTVRDVFADCLAADEATIVMYTGYNQLKANYVHYGFNRVVNPLLVENNAGIWQLEIPMSVTPETVIYPDYVDHGVFANGGTQAAPIEICAYSVTSTTVIQSPMIVGPTPIEELAMVETRNLFPNNPV